jgi:outer membrane protein TolC
MSRRIPVLITVALLVLALPRLGVVAAEPDDLTALRKEQLETARKGLEAVENQFQAGQATLESTLEWARRVRRAELALTDKKSERVAAWEKYLKRVQEIEKISKARFDAARITLSDYLAATYDRQEAEIRLAEAKAK